ncbi:MAG: tetratricopeptide repeat protein [Pyrinomonadaceae bacterium]|nr:tetratricopeptide repeat protein [Pyrinomonadaceae bacterium]
MKSFSSIAAVMSGLLFVLAVNSAGLRTAHAQTAAPSPSTTTTQTKPADSPTQEQSTAAQSSSQEQQSTTRERRAQAYAKLLEGQRLLGDARRGSPDASLRQARQAFQSAATLDPTLAEAHTALAELAFYYPPQDFEIAIREASQATRIDRNSFGAHRLLARVYTLKSGLRENKLDKTFVERAIEELKEVVRLDSNNAEAWALLGEFYYATGRNQEAINALTQWAAAPAPLETRFFQYVANRELSTDAAAARLGEALIAAGRTTEAVAAIRRAISINPENKDYSELLVRAFEEGGNNETAISELQRMIVADPTNPSLPRLLARIQARMGRIDEAVATIRTAMSKQPQGQQEQKLLRLYLAKLLTDALRDADAIAVYEEALKERGISHTLLASDDDKEFASIILQRILALQKSAGLTKDAAATIERMRSLFGKDDSTADEEHIELLRHQGKRNEALLAIRAARQRFPDESDFVRLEAETLTELGRVDEAVALLQPRLKGSLEDFNEYLTISTLYIQAGRGREAIEAARKALALAPAERTDLQTAALITLSSAQDRAGDPAGSEESLRRVLNKEPDNATALNNLGYFLVERNERLNEALELIQRAVRAEPTNSSFLDSLGWVYFKLGQLENAERHLKEAARRNSTSSTIHEHLGDLYHRQGKTELARAAWQKALSLSLEVDKTARLKAKLSGKFGN